MMSFDKFVPIITILAIVQSINCDHKLYIVKKSGSKSYDTALLVTWDETEDEINAECDIISGRDRIKNALQSANYPSVETITDDDLQEYLQDCDTVNEIQYEEGREVRKASKTKTTKTSSQTTTPAYDGIPVIFPGTKWCGAGDRAKHYDDLGLHQDTDRCCRAHDLCNDTLAPGETKNGLTNTSPFTKLSCQCDEDFYNCLDRINSVTSNTIGNMYFNILKRECYKKDYPDSKKCKKYRTIFKLKCIEYEKNTKAAKVYKWVPAKKYKKIPFPGPITVTLPDIIPF